MRQRLTEIDYAIIAVAPALIMVLVGSLVLFLTDLIYDGPHSLRLNFILCMFVLGIVSIARISIEQGTLRAVPFGVVLGGLITFAVARFVPDAIVVACALLVIVWWVSTRLVYDCTVVDQSVDASKKGLMQWIRSTSQDEAESSLKFAASEQPLGVTGRDEHEPKRSRWTWIDASINPTTTQFAPGVWVVYFSLAALPIFGLGQAFAGQRAQDNRWYLFTLLVAYVAAALSLMVTTSFLGLRRYLQRRGTPMPLSMTGVWLGVGMTGVALVLITVSVLPRPNAEYELAQFPYYQDQESRVASRVASGQDGTSDKRTDREGAFADPKQTDDQPPPLSESRADGQGPGADTASEEVTASGESSEAGEQSSGDSQSHDPESQGGRGRQKQQGESQGVSEAASPQQEPGQGKASDSDSSDDRAYRPDPAAQQESEARTNGDRNPVAPDSADAGSPPSETAQPPASDPPLGSLLSSWGSVLKLIVYAVVAGFIVLLLWHFRDELAQSWGEFWGSLFGRRERKQHEPIKAEAPPVHRRPAFSAFVSPFQAPGWKGRPLEDWVRYSFSAVEAWAEERGHGRQVEQTPAEFASMLERHYADFENSVRQVADLYGQVAYGSGKAPGETTEILRNLWQRLRAS